MAKFEEISNLYQETAAKVTTSPKEWLKFVGTASNLYRYPFEDQLIIYAQRPDARQCAPMDYWNNNLRCYVNKGAKGIALLDRQARGNKLRYVFDMSDVHKVSDRSIMPYQWELPDDAKYLVANTLERKYLNTEIPYESLDFEDRIIQIADQIAADMLPDFEESILGKLGNSALSEIYEENRGEILQDALSASIASMLLTRCGVDPKECEDRLTGLQYISMFDSIDTLSELGTLTSNLAKPVLIDIEKEVGRYERINRIENTVETGYNRENANEERGEDNGNRVRTERGLSDSQTESERSTGGNRGDREVRTSSGEVSERVQGGDLRSVSNDGGLVGTSDNDRPTSERAQGSDNRANEESRGSESANAGGEFRSVSSESADDRTGSGENGLGGNDLHLEEPQYEQLSLFPTETEQVESIKAAENEVTAAFSVADIEKAVREHSTIRLSIPENLHYEDQPVPIRNARAEEFKNMRIAFDDESNSMLLLADTEHDSGLWLRDFGNVDFSSELVAQIISDYLAEHQMQISNIEPVQEHDIEQSQEKEFEKRLYRDGNGFYNVQIRQVPVEDWQQNDGWGTVFVTEIYNNAMDRLSKEPGIDVTERSEKVEDIAVSEEQPVFRAEDLTIGDVVVLPPEVMTDRDGKEVLMPSERATITGITDNWIEMETESGAKQSITPNSMNEIGFQLVFHEPEQGIFRIYQMKDGEEYHYAHFENMETLEKEGIRLNHEDYNLVYEGNLADIPGNTDQEKLEHIFEKFGNSPFEERPADFKGYSVSVSDVITFDRGNGEEPHFVDSWGFKDFPSFLQEKEEVKEVQNEEVPLPNVKVEWSESPLFESGKTYSIAEFDSIMHEADLSRHAKQQELIEKHGSWQAWYDSNDQTDLLSYEKVKITVTFKDGTSQTERQDIGDGIGGLLEFLSHYDKYKDYMSELREAAGREEDKKIIQENALEENPYELLSLAIGDHLVDDKGVLWTVTNNGNFLLSIEKAEENRVDSLQSARSFTNWQNRVKETGNIDDFDRFRKITIEEYLAEQGSQEIPGKSVIDTAKLEEQIDVLKDENDGFRSLLGRDDVSASEKAEYRSKLTANLNDIERLGGIIANERIRVSEQAEEIYVRFGTIPVTEKSVNYLKLNSEQRQDITDQIENGSSPEEAVEYLKENLNSWKNVDSTEIFEDGISVFKADSNGLPVIENLQQAISLSVRLDDPVYLVSGDVVGTGQDGEPLLVNVSGKEAEISRSQLQDIIVSSLSKGFAAQTGTIDTDDLNIHRFAGDIVTFMGFEFSEPVSKEWGKSVESEADIQQVQPEKVSRNFHITDYDLGKGGAKEKFRRNVEAIKTLRKIEDEDRAATPEEQQILSQYIGWGGLSDAFDSRKPNWSKEFIELKELLTPEEYAAARSTTRDAFFTSPEVIEGIYGTLDRMGFDKGNILEPSMGVGNFFGMLPEKMQDSKLYGVELDSISGRIAKKLYPDANIQITGYQDTGFDNNSFDVAVGNVPFDNYVPFDKDYSKQRFMLHDYFFAKTLDKVRPGGVIAFVTSKGTLDKEDPKVRKYIAQRAEFLGAIRLPGGKDGAFKDNAGTEVTSDIIFLQKRDGIVDVDPDWVHLGMDENGIAMNQYFVDHPEQIVGHMAMVSGRFGMETACVADTEKPFKEQYNAALSGIIGKYTAVERSPQKEAEQEETLLPSPEDKNFSYVVRNDKVYYRENTALVPQKLKGDKEERIKGMVEIRDLTQNLLNMQLNDASDDEVAAAQEKLNNAYDSFVKEHGRIDSDRNKRAFSDDNSYSLIRALEKYDDNGEFKGKADIFTKRTIQRAVAVTSVETASEALSVCLNEKAAVDIEFMSKLCHKPENEVIEDLQGIIFKNPITDRFETSDEYLSGNVRNKLAVARSYAEQNPEFAINVAALESVQPKELSAGDIDVRLGATWIDPKYIKDFMQEVLDTSWYDLKYGTIDCKFNDISAKWWIEGKTKDKRNVKVNDVFGTPRMNAYEILEDTLNLKTCEVHDTYIDDDGKKKTKVNKDATIVAQQKQDALKEAFQSWVFAVPERREALVKRYNEIFNSTRPREFNGDYITLPGSNPNITLKKHQKDSVARIISGENTLLAHCVGAGKTFTMVAGAMESKRLGLCKKSMFVVPNHLTEQWGSEFRTLYPNANILVATKKDFEPANRKKFISRIATGNYDAVIIGHTQFLKIPVSKEREAAFIQSEIDDAVAARESLDEREDRHTIKDIEGIIKRKKAKLEEKLGSPVRDDVVTFEQLGVDRLFVDESHNFKNLEMTTKMSRIAGVQTSDAEKSNDLLMKCRYLDEITDGKGVTFATGTPISNSMTELYTNMRYLQMAKLKELGLNHFDKWASTFGETVTAMEVSPEGQNYRAKTRFSKFFNLPELMSIFKEAADVRTSDMLNLPVPEAEYVDVVLEKSPEQEAILESIGERAEKIRGGSVDSSVDNMLKITNDGRKMALDQRLYSDMLPDNPNSKAAACAENIAQIYRDTMQEKSTQLVFCDLGTPSSKSEEGRFNVYEDIKQKLIAKGIPENEIAFIHDCDKGSNPDKKKDELFAKVRSGKVRVLIGSTPKLGAGTNIQDRLIALHHMDVPWRPADLEQQEGRILRQGNQNSKVKIFRYITKGTFDTYNWQTIEKKQTFIGQIMTSKSPVRSHDDVDDAALKYAEVKALASDNPLIAEKMTLEVDVQKLRVAKSAHTNQIYAMQDNIAKHYPAQIASDKELIKCYKEDIAIHNAHKPADKDSFSITVGNRTLVDKKEGAEVLQAVIRNNTKFMGDYEKIGSYRGFDVCMRFDLMTKKFDLKLVGETAHYVNDVGHDAFGTITKMNNVLDNMPHALENIVQRLENTEKQLETAKAEVTKPFPKEAELTEKQQRLSEVDALLKMDEKEAPVIASDEEKSVDTEPCKSGNDAVVEPEQKAERATKEAAPEEKKQEVFAVAYKDGAGKANMAYVECDSKESAENHIRSSVPNSTVMRALPFKKEAIPAGKEVINIKDLIAKKPEQKAEQAKAAKKKSGFEI